MATAFTFSNPSQAELPLATQQRARQLYETLERFAAELSAADELDPEVKQRGLAVVHHAADCAQRLIQGAERSVVRRAAAKPSSPQPLPEAHRDE